MTPVILLEELKKFIEESTKNILLETKNKEKNCERVPKVILGNLPRKEAETNDVPYIVLKFLTGKDLQEAGAQTEAKAKIRILAVTYSEDRSKGYIDALNVITKIRFDLLMKRVVGKCFKLDLPVEYIVYEEDISPYTIAEMVCNFDIPPIEQEVNKWL